MSNKRIDQLPATSSFASTDLFEKERDPSGVKVHEKATLGDFVTFLLPQVQTNVYANLASLKANTSPMDGKAYLILGYLTRGDGQAKCYFYDASSIATPDDGGVVKPDNVLVTDPGRYRQISF